MVNVPSRSAVRVYEKVVLMERDICPLTMLMLVDDDVFGPERRLKPLNVGPRKSLAWSLTTNLTVKLSPWYTDCGACTVISCAMAALNIRRHVNMLSVCFIVFSLCSTSLCPSGSCCLFVLS